MDEQDGVRIDIALGLVRKFGAQIVVPHNGGDRDAVA